MNIGLFCSTPMVALSRNVSRKHAMEMLLTGDMISANQAYHMGLVNRVVTHDTLEAETMALAQQIASKPRATVKIGKEAFYRQLEMPLSEAYDYASQGHDRKHAPRRSQRRHLRLRRKARSEMAGVIRTSWPSGVEQGL